MKRFIGVAIVLSVFVAIPSSAHAQRGGRGSKTVQTPYGPMVNPNNTPEWRQAGGNYGVWLELMQQKAQAAEDKEMQKQYKAMIKEQQAYEKWLKDQAAKKAKGQPVDPAYASMVAEEEAEKKAIEAEKARLAAKAARQKSKKSNAKAVAKPATPPADASSKDKAESKPATDEKATKAANAPKP